MAFGKTGSFSNETFKPNDFWPELSVATFQQDYKFPPDFAIDSVKMIIKHAIFDVLKALKEQEAAWLAQGFEQIEDVVPQDVVLDTYAYAAKFEHAVFALAKAKLFAQLEGMTRKETSESLSEEAEKNQDYWLAESKKAIKAIKGQTNITAELI